LYFVDGMVEEIITALSRIRRSDAQRRRSQGRGIGGMTATRRLAAIVAVDVALNVSSGA